MHSGALGGRVGGGLALLSALHIPLPAPGPQTAQDSPWQSWGGHPSRVGSRDAPTGTGPGGSVGGSVGGACRCRGSGPAEQRVRAAREWRRGLAAAAEEEREEVARQARARAGSGSGSGSGSGAG